MLAWSTAQAELERLRLIDAVVAGWMSARNVIVNDANDMLPFRLI